MHTSLIVARDAAVARHDRVREQYADNYNAAFAAALEPVIAEFERIIAGANADKSDPVELSRTLRWLGDTWFDHGRFARAPSWRRGADAYGRAEDLLQGVCAPVEQAKLDFNYGNTLVQLSEGTNVELLEEAEARYLRAARMFRESLLLQFAQQVEKQHKVLRVQLELGRQKRQIDQGHQRLQELSAEAASADSLAQGRIRQELGELTGRLDAPSIIATLRKGLAVASELSPTKSAELSELEAKVAMVTSALSAKPGIVDQIRTNPQYDDLVRQLSERIREAGAGHKISPDRAGHLQQLLQTFMAAIPHASDDVLTHEAKLLRMQSSERQAADALISRERPLPRPGSRAARAMTVVEALQRIILGERERRMLPAQESQAALDLLTNVSQLAATLEQAVDDDTRVVALEPQIWRLAINVQQFARRYHLVVAKPDFPMLAERASVKSLFISGSAALHEAGARLAQRDGIELFWQARRGEAAQERWGQLLAASIAAFDIGVPDGPGRMQVCYELGLALALGKACVIVKRTDTVVPFDIEIPAIVFSGDKESNFRALETSLYAALSSVTWGGRAPQLGGAGENSVVAMEEHARQAAMPVHLDVQLRMARANAIDAVALRGTLEHIAGNLGAHGPAILLPAWPPAGGPARATRQQCFHVMPFSKDWSPEAKKIVADACANEGWEYRRGDEGSAQRIIPGIWQEVCLSSAVVIDITGYNINVGLELGLVHALGRPYRVVTRGHPKDHLFPALEKVQVHGYRHEPADSNGWLSRFTPKVRDPNPLLPSLAQIIGPFLRELTSHRG